MATDTPQTIQPAMEDILSSIRTGIEEEGAKVGSGSADLIDAAAAQDAEDDVLELSADDMVGGPTETEGSEELIDIAAFASSGESREIKQDKKTAAELAADLLGEGTAMEAEAPSEAPAAPVIEGASDEFDRLLAEISQEQQQQVAAAEISKQALMDEEDPLGTDTSDEAAEQAETPSVDEFVQTVETAVVNETVAAISTASVGAPSYSLSTVQTGEGMQVAFPAEVLAMALRPMVQDWLAKNLPGVVEKLVKDEISKLAQG